MKMLPHRKEVKQLKMLSTIELAERWGMSNETIAQWRVLDKGPPYVKLGGAVRYRIEDIETYERENLSGVIKFEEETE